MRLAVIGPFALSFALRRVQRRFENVAGTGSADPAASASPERVFRTRGLDHRTLEMVR